MSVDLEEFVGEDPAYEDFLEFIEAMREDDDGRWTFADDTLSGIADTVSSAERVTPGQYGAIKNIWASAKHHRRR